MLGSRVVQRYFSRVGLIVFAPAVIAMASCGNRGDDGLGAAQPIPTSIPVGAPGAEGARFDPPAAALAGPRRNLPNAHPNPEDPLSPGLNDEEEESPNMPEPTPIHPSPVKSKGTKL